MKFLHGLKNRKKIAIASIVGLLALNVYLIAEFGGQGSDSQVALTGQVSRVTTLSSFSEDKANQSATDVSVSTSVSESTTSENTINYTTVVTNNGSSAVMVSLNDPLSFGICGDADGDGIGVECFVQSDHPSADCSASSSRTGIVCELELAAGETATQTATAGLSRLSSGNRINSATTVTVNGAIDSDLSNNTSSYELVIGESEIKDETKR